ncbi:hypothetical protein B0T22DRAFT_437548 [Podospora appendiculata]|uniref:Uncharacterized protein n=1 Tax=Podospora appendiculata TaxID=314037 RepID=A0AAE1CH78_9PEZI|nr:hypothetical protein B0T22DRAFT_437548 [Podospora appendiculata]
MAFPRTLCRLLAALAPAYPHGNRVMNALSGTLPTLPYRAYPTVPPVSRRIFKQHLHQGPAFSTPVAAVSEMINNAELSTSNMKIRASLAQRAQELLRKGPTTIYPGTRHFVFLLLRWLAVAIVTSDTAGVKITSDAQRFRAGTHAR